MVCLLNFSTGKFFCGLARTSSPAFKDVLLAGGTHVLLKDVGIKAFERWLFTCIESAFRLN